MKDLNRNTDMNTAMLEAAAFMRPVTGIDLDHVRTYWWNTDEERRIASYSRPCLAVMIQDY